MATAWDQFISILDQTEHLYQDLLAIARRERDLVMDAKVDQLSAVLAQKQNLLAQLSVLEKKRTFQMKQFAGQMQLPLQQLNLSRLAEQMPAVYAQKIQDRQAALRRIVADLGTANKENRSLLRHCLALVQGGLQFLQHWVAPPSVYGASGNINGRSEGGRFLSGTV